MTNIQAWAMAARPKTLFAGIGPVVLGLGLAYQANASITVSIALLTLLCVILMQTGTNLVNDYFDEKTGVDDKDRLGPMRAIHQGLLSAQQIRRGYQICFSLALIFGSYLMYHGGPIIIFIGLSSLLLAYIYTAGPFPLSHYALGELTALLYFGPVAVWGSAYLQNPQQTLSHLLLGLSVGWISAAIMAINNLRDRENDQQKNKITLAVLLGEKGARLLVLGFIFLSFLWPIYYAYLWQAPALILTSTTTILFFSQWKKIYSAPVSRDFNNVLGNTGKYLFLYSLIFAATLVFNAN